MLGLMEMLFESSVSEIAFVYAQGNYLLLKSLGEGGWDVHVSLMEALFPNSAASVVTAECLVTRMVVVGFGSCII